MIVCNRCGKENQDHYKFCLGCGAELSPDDGTGNVGTMKTMMAESGGRSSPTPPGGVPHHGGGVRRTRIRDVVLKCVDELVAEHVIGGVERPGERQNDPPLIGFGHTAGAFTKVSFDHVRLTELRTAAVEHERLPAP
jgi:hypothetical protein